MRSHVVHLRPGRGWFDIDWREFWASRELLMLLVRRDVSVVYKQTILGPLWFLVQPILMAIVFAVVFGRIARIPTDGLPRIMFYLSGLLFWNYFRGSLDGAANSFAHGKPLFSKVYFPRLMIPLTYPLSHLVYFFWNLLVFLVFYVFHIVNGLEFRPTWGLLLLPLLVFYVGLAATGVGMIIAALSAKYRDVKFAMPFVLQVWMYSSPIIFSVRGVTTTWIEWVLLLNPLSVAVEGFRLMFFGTGIVTPKSVIVGIGVTLTSLIVGLAAFNHVQHDFIDTI